MALLFKYRMLAMISHPIFDNMNIFSKSLYILVFLLFLSFGISAKDAHLTDNPLRFVVYYNGDAHQMIQDSNGYFKTFLDAYNLAIVNTFEIDAEHKGFTLEVKEGSINANELAKELSIIEGVIMVEVYVAKSPKIAS